MQKNTERQLVASHIGKVTQSEVFWLILFLNVKDNVMVKVPLKQKNLYTARGPFRRTEVAARTDDMFMAEKRVTKP